MLQGVSQQPTRIRVDGQVTEQINYVSDVAQGLTSRPATEQVFEFDSVAVGTRFYNVEVSGVDYILGYAPGVMRIWDLAGTEYPVAYQDAAAQTYIGSDMRFYVYDQTVYCTNRDKVVEIDPTPVGYPHYAVYATCLGGNFSRTYRVTVIVEGTEYEASYTTPDGTAAGDANKTSSSYIVQQLANSLNSLGMPTNVFVSTHKEVLRVKSVRELDIQVDDGEAGAVLRGVGRTVEDITHLPPYADQGTVVTVVGDNANEDDYYLRFRSSKPDNGTGGFRATGYWEEWYKPDQPSKLAHGTMPHRLYLKGGIFYFEREVWTNRKVGDSVSSPMPSFVGNSIRDISGFESRLVFSAGPNVIMSRTNDEIDFFRKSVTTVVDDDPIDMKSTKENSLRLDWIVPFDRDLILLSDPGEAQFIVKGGGVTPSNASLVLSTTFSMFGKARPVTTGRTLIFPFRSGRYSGLKEFFTNDQVSTNGADTLTEVQSRYITGEVNNIASTKNFNMLAVGTDDPATSNTIWTYKYLWEGAERMQSSWSKWVLHDDPVYFFFDNSVFYIVVKDEADRYFLCKADLNRVTNVEGWHVTLDRLTTETVGLSKVTLDVEDAVIVQSTGCLDPGREAVVEFKLPVVGGATEYYLSSDICPDGATVYGGVKLRRSIWPTMPLIRDRTGAAITSAVITIGKFVVHLDDSSDVGAVMHCKYREPYEFYPRRFPLDDEPGDPGRTLVMDYDLEVPWGERADFSELELFSTDVRPTTILEIEWEGQVTGAKRRV
tara:strand:+ start:17842 stop:20151 length:2310 start_codon:yes stop_codon:yes gene_type:complete